MKDILSKPFSNIPLSLANTNGSLCKTSKVVLLHKIEELVPNKGKYLNPNVSVISTALILDGVAELHLIPLPLPQTFGELSLYLLEKIKSKGRNYGCTRVDFVTDRYKDISIKIFERTKRANQGSECMTIYGKDQKTPKQWKKFLTQTKLHCSVLF